MYHYPVPSEFIRQRTVIIWFVTVEHAIAVFAGYLLGEALGGSTLATAVCIALGLAVTTLKVQGLVLYRFVPIGIAFLLRRLRGQTVVPDEGPATLPQVNLSILDAEGRPIIFQER